jgi:acyl carrier protein
METAMSEGTPTHADVSDALRRFLREHFPVARQTDLSDDAPLLDSGIVDSLGILELVNFVTETFGVAVSDEDLQPENFSSIRRLALFVERRCG